MLQTLLEGIRTLQDALFSQVEGLQKSREGAASEALRSSLFSATVLCG